MRKSPISLSTFVFGLLAVTALAYAIPLFYTNYAQYSTLQETVRGTAPTEEALSDLGQSMGLGLLFVLVILTAVFLIATLTLFRLVIAPIKRLEQAYAELSAGNLHVQVVPEGLAEIQHIGTDFNEATRIVRTKTEELAHAKEKLQEANEKLEAEFRQAKKLNDLTVGRELAMVKMKEEMDSLRSAVAKTRGT